MKAGRDEVQLAKQGVHAFEDQAERSLSFSFHQAFLAMEIDA
jgi:hypothetical protein